MDDTLLQRMKDDRGFLAETLEKIPLLREYVENRSLWEADRTVRDAIGARLEGLKGPVGRAVREASGDVRAAGRLADLESLLTRIDTVANAVRFADYGHSGMTANVKIRPADLERLLAFDRGLFSSLEETEEAAGNLEGEGEKVLGAGLDRFEKEFSRRAQCLVEVAGAGDREE